MQSEVAEYAFDADGSKVYVGSKVELWDDDGVCARGEVTEIWLSDEDIDMEGTYRRCYTVAVQCGPVTHFLQSPEKPNDLVWFYLDENQEQPDCPVCERAQDQGYRTCEDHADGPSDEEQIDKAYPWRPGFMGN